MGQPPYSVLEDHISRVSCHQKNAIDGTKSRKKKPSSSGGIDCPTSFPWRELALCEDHNMSHHHLARSTSLHRNH